MPYFSIIMPAKNREKLIDQAIQSIIDQTFQDWELIVVDDHSTDNTARVIKSFKDPRIKYYYLILGTGPGAARDFGIKKAKGEIIVLADSDDINFPNRLQLTCNRFKKYNAVSIVYGIAKREKNGKITSRPVCPFNPELLKRYNFITNPTAAFRKKAYLKTKGYDTKIQTSEDYDLWLTFLEKDFKFAFINKPLVLLKIHSQNITAKTHFEQRIKNLAYVREKHHLPIPKPEQVKKLVNKKLWDFIFTPRGKEFWFGIQSE